MDISGDFRKSFPFGQRTFFFFYWMVISNSLIWATELSVGCSWIRACDVTRTSNSLKREKRNFKRHYCPWKKSSLYFYSAFRQASPIMK